MSDLIRYDLGDAVVNFLLVVTLCVALVSSAAWLVARMFMRNAALRRFVLLAALACCLVAPALVWFSRAAGVAFVEIPILGDQQATKRVVSRAEPVLTPPPTSREPSPPPEARQSVPQPGTAVERPANVTPEPAAVASPTVQSITEPWNVVTATFLAWAAGALLMLTRLARNCARVIRLRRSSTPSRDDAHLLLMRDAAAKLGMRRVPVLLVSNRAVTPLALGFGRTAIILPQQLLDVATDEELRDVFVHELAHVQRGDQRIVLLQGLAGALYWPIVSVHMLNRALRRASEELCDNVVLTHRNPIRYGETLLRVAELLVGARPVRAAVGIVGGRGELERRIAGLIDPRRSTKTTIGRRAAWFVTLAFVAACSMASATRFAGAAGPSSTTQAAPTDERLANTPPSEQELLKRTVVLHGKVVDPNGRAVAGARLHLSADPWGDPIELGTSGADGGYRFAVPERSFHHTMDGSIDKDVRAALIALADGYGAAWAVLDAPQRDGWQRMKSEYAIDLQLAVEVPITGQVVDASGKPLVGAEVTIGGMFRLTDPGWEPMLNAIKAGDPGRLDEKQTHQAWWESPLNRTAFDMIPPVKTDAEGRFRVAHAGRDRAVNLRVEGPGIRDATVTVLTRDDVVEFTRAIRDKAPHVVDPDGYFYPQRDGAPQGNEGARIFDPSPTIQVDPDRTVSGVVRDARTGAPIPNVRMLVGSLSARTDRNGRYRALRGGDSDVVWVHAQPDTSRNLIGVRAVEVGRGFGEAVVDFDLPSGVIVTGRVLEAQTGRPIVSGRIVTCHAPWPGAIRAGWVHYYPLATNAALRGTQSGLYFEAAPSREANYHTSAVIGEDGTFRMAVPPGPGVLLVMAAPGFPTEFGGGPWHEREGLHRLFPYTPLSGRAGDDGAPAGDADALAGFSGPIRVTPFHAYRVINPPADATSLDVTLNVPRAPSRVVRFVGPDGRAMNGVRVQGLSLRGMTIILEGSEAEVLGLEPGNPRQLIAFSSDDRYAARANVVVGGAEPVTLQLQPAAAIIGRVVDETGKPLRKALLSPISPPGFGVVVDPEVGYIPQVRADAEGRFRIAPLLPGERYYAEIRGGEYDNEVAGNAFENVILKSGEVRDVGEIRIKPPAGAN